MLMDERQFLAVISGEQRGVAPALLCGALSVASHVYAVGVALRNVSFNHRWSRIHRVDAPVISVGNLTTGGTGKTPFVAWLINDLRRRGRQPGLLSRGYRSFAAPAKGGLGGVIPNSTSNFARTPPTTPLERGGERLNDEAQVIEWLCPGMPHVQQRDRVAGVHRLRNPGMAIPGLPVDVILLDDGFQHRRLHRDLDIVLIDALQPWGYGRLLPRGLLREPPSALKRADIVLLTRADLVEPEALEELRHEICRVRGIGSDGEIAFRPTRLVNASGQSRPLAELSSMRVAAFCGIGNPHGFARSLQSLGVTTFPRAFPDHHAYSPADWNELIRWGDAQSANILVTTLKDLVKLPVDHPAASRVWAVDIGVEWLRGEQIVIERISIVLGPTAQCVAA